VTDVLTLLRDANPVREDQLTPSLEPTWQRIENTRPSARRRRVRRGWLALAPVAAAGAAIALLASGTTTTPSLAARVYAAIASRGDVLHYDELQSANHSPGGPVKADELTVNWVVSGLYRHVLVYSWDRPAPHDQPTLFEDLAFTPPGIIDDWTIVIPDLIDRTVIPKKQREQCGELADLCGLRKVLRRFRDAGTQIVHGQRLDVFVLKTTLGGTHGTSTSKIFIDPRTFYPVLETNTGDGFVDTTRYFDYTRSTLNANTRRRLQLRPHPGARMLSGAAAERVIRAASIGTTGPSGTTGPT
jgi:hypothetical protein